MGTYPELSGKVAVISGAGGNLALAVISHLHAAGVKLALIDRDEDGIRSRLRANDIDDTTTLIGVVDLLQRAAVDAFTERVVGHYGRMDITLNIAGGYKSQPPIHELDEATWDYLLNLNAKTVFLLSSAAARHMIAGQTHGRIINVAARAALKGDPTNAAYAASKSAVIRLTESMAAELMDHGITVNAVLPSVIDTPPNRAANPGVDYSRWVSAESLADVITFLASDAARDISGASIPVYGRS